MHLINYTDKHKTNERHPKIISVIYTAMDVCFQHVSLKMGLLSDDHSGRLSPHRSLVGRDRPSGRFTHLLFDYQQGKVDSCS